MKYVIVFILASLITGCSSPAPDPATEDQYGHVHGPASSSVVTLFADSLELFMEYGPLIREEESGFLAHFTILSDEYLPLSGSEVKLKIIRNGEEEEIPFEARDVDGIYHAHYIPAEEGKCNITVVATFHGKPVSFDLGIVDIYHYDHDVPAAEDEHEELIVYTKEQAWKTDFATAPVERKPFYQVIRTSGQVLPARGDEMMVPATASGIVRSGSVDLLAGILVKKDRWLFSIIQGDIAQDNLQVDIELARNTLEKARSDFKRAEELKKENIISQKRYLAAQKELTDAETRYNALTKNVTDEGKQVLAPMSGFLKTVYVHEGDYVTVGQPLAMVSQNRRLILKADVSPKYTSDLPRVVSANFRSLYNNKLYNVSDLHGKLVSYGKTADNYTFYTPVFFEFDNRGEIVPGSFTEVFLKLSPRQDVLVIPITALTDEAGLKYVYVQEDGEHFEKRSVKTGEDDGRNIVILEGLVDGERIVSRGAIQVKMAALSSSIPHGHAH